MTSITRVNAGLHRLRKAAKKVKEASSSDAGDAVNITDRSNVRFAGTIGGMNSVHHSSASQATRIRQVNGQTAEDSEIISHHGSSMPNNSMKGGHDDGAQ
jgi:hypothetical protein